MFSSPSYIEELLQYAPFFKKKKKNLKERLCRALLHINWQHLEPMLTFLCFLVWFLRGHLGIAMIKVLSNQAPSPWVQVLRAVILSKDAKG